MKRIKELDGLRAFAIFSVFLVHFHPAHTHTFDPTTLGWAGVDLFFAISGFLITGVLLKLRAQESALKTFYWRRVIRIFPIYYVALMVIVLLALAHGEGFSRTATAEASTFLLSLSKGFSLPLFMGRLFFHAGFGVIPDPVVHYHYHFFLLGINVFWSLSVEELFYLLWAPVILNGSRRFILVSCLAPLFLCPALRFLLHTAPHYEAFNFACRFDSLAAGGCVALLFAAVRSGRLPVRILERGLVTAGFASALFLFLLSWRCGVFDGIELRSVTMFSVFGYALLAILFSAITGACTHWSGSYWTSALRWKPLAYLGMISYSMYLFHVPVYVAAGILMSPREWTSSMFLLQGFIATLGTVAIAALSWKYFESPILQFRNPPSFVRGLVGMPAEATAGD